MCTAISFNADDHYFGRTLDLEYSYDEKLVITPRYFPLKFTNNCEQRAHYAIFGIATVVENYPLYYDAANEKGLCMAALNFPKNAHYFDEKEGKINIAPFELISFILSQCDCVKKCRNLLDNINITNKNFSNEYPNTPLHWIVSDKEKSIVIEQTEKGLEIYDNPVGVLTNNPPFLMQLFNLNNYINLRTTPVNNHFCKDLQLEQYSNGMGALGLPGDLSSQSRFVRAAFTTLNSVCENNESEAITRFFHILNTVSMTKGCVKVSEKDEITVYTSCYNAEKGFFYYTTYQNSQICAVDINKENLDSDSLIKFGLIQSQKINYIN